MPETVDPRQALRSDDVAVRAAGARDLAGSGTFADALVLIELAKADKSPSVRLYAAAGAADIVMREGLDSVGRRAVVDAVRSFDPGRNPALLMVMAAVPDAEGIDRLGRLMRDPRSDVRGGATAALKRMAGTPDADRLLAEAVRGWLVGGKHPADAVAELVRLTSEAGWPGMDEAIRGAAGKGRAAAVAVQDAMDWMVARRDPGSWVGLWAATDDERIVDWLYLEKVGPTPQAWGPDGVLGVLTVDDGVGSVAGRPPLLRVRGGRPTDDGPSEALRVGERMLWRHTGRVLVKLVEMLDEVLRTCPPAALGVARDLAPLEGASAVRARAIALWRGGALKEAEQVLDQIVAGDKKPRPEIQWLVGNVKLGLGDLDSAREALRICVQLAPKKANWKAEAEAILTSLGG